MQRFGDRNHHLGGDRLQLPFQDRCHSDDEANSAPDFHAETSGLENHDGQDDPSISPSPHRSLRSKFCGRRARLPQDV